MITKGEKFLYESIIILLKYKYENHLNEKGFLKIYNRLKWYVEMIDNFMKEDKNDTAM